MIIVFDSCNSAFVLLYDFSIDYSFFENETLGEWNVDYVYFYEFFNKNFIGVWGYRNGS